MPDTSKIKKTFADGMAKTIQEDSVKMAYIAKVLQESSPQAFAQDMAKGNLAGTYPNPTISPSDYAPKWQSRDKTTGEPWGPWIDQTYIHPSIVSLLNLELTWVTVKMAYANKIRQWRKHPDYLVEEVPF